MTTNMIKNLGYAATIIGLGAELLGQWVADKELDRKIAEKIRKAL